MAATWDDIVGFLTRDRWRYLHDAEGQRLVCPNRGSDGRLDLEIRLTEDGHCVHFRVAGVVDLAGAAHREQVLETLCQLHFAIKLGRFGLDPSGTSVDCEIILPLEDAPLTYRQFRRCCGALLMLVEQQAPRLRAIAAEGRAPAGDEGDLVESFLSGLAEAFDLPRDVLLRHLEAIESAGEEPGEPPGSPRSR